MSGEVDRDQKKFRNLNLAKLRKGGEEFEIDIEPNLAIEFSQGKDVDIKDVLKAEKVFANAKKGLLASEEKMNELFGTTDVLEIAKIILKQGEIQVTSEYRDKLRAEKKRKVINIIHANAIDPKTGYSHPENRIEAAMDEAKIRINEYASAEEQVDDVIKNLRPIIPIKFDTKVFELQIKSNYAQQCMGIIKSMSKIKDQKWGNDGELITEIEIPGGLSEEFFDKLNSITHGTLNSKMVN